METATIGLPLAAACSISFAITDCSFIALSSPRFQYPKQRIFTAEPARFGHNQQPGISSPINLPKGM